MERLQHYIKYDKCGLEITYIFSNRKILNNQYYKAFPRAVYQVSGGLCGRSSLPQSVGGTAGERSLAVTSCPSKPDIVFISGSYLDNYCQYIFGVI